MTISLVKKKNAFEMRQPPAAFGDPQFRFDKKILKFNELDDSNLLFRPTEFHFHSDSNAMAETNE